MMARASLRPGPRCTVDGLRTRSPCTPTAVTFPGQGLAPALASSCLNQKEELASAPAWTQSPFRGGLTGPSLSSDHGAAKVRNASWARAGPWELQGEKDAAHLSPRYSPSPATGAWAPWPLGEDNCQAMKSEVFWERA